MDERVHNNDLLDTGFPQMYINGQGQQQTFLLVKKNLDTFKKWKHYCNIKYERNCYTGEAKAKKRDRYTVLNALSSTIGEVPDRPDYRFFDDVILNARTSVKTRELALAIKSGEKAAEYILETYPDLVRLRQPVPAWPKSEEVLHEMDISIENLNRLIQSGEKIPKIIEMYEALKANGDLTIENHNEMLAFASYHSLPSSSGSAEPQEQNQSTSDGEENMEVNTDVVTTWRKEGYAESLFVELRDTATPQTFEVFILGLLKHGEFTRAYDLFQDFNDKGWKGSSFFYDTLIKHVLDVRTGDQDRWNLVEEIVKSMKGVAQPTTVTFTNLMSVAVEQTKDAPMLCQRLFGEMKKANIVPSLAALYYLLLAERKAFEIQKDYNQNIKVLYICVEEIQSGKVNLNLVHPSDFEFFHMAMHLARFKRVGEVAEKLLDVLLKNKLTPMLGVRGKTFYGNFLAAVARSPKDMDSVFKQYERLVPSFLIPHDWVYEQLFFASRNNKDTSYIPRLYNDMTKYNVYLMNPKLLPALYLALDCHIPQERADEFLHIIEHSQNAMENIDVSAETRQNMLSTTINILCMNSKADRAMEIAKSLKSQGTNPTYKSLLKILSINIEKHDKKSTFQTLKLMAEMNFQFEESLKEMISNSFISKETEKIESWFNTSN